MRPHLLLAAGIAVIPWFVTPLLASDLRTPADTTSRVSPAPDSLRVQTMLMRADEASYAGRVGEARRLYRELIDQQTAGDEFAGAALWRLATTNLYADDTRGAAEVLDELARGAARFGDPTWELRATFEAAVLYSALKRNDLVNERIERVRSLLKSPVIADREKDMIRERIREQ